MPKIGLRSFRPPGCTGKGDKQLGKIHTSLMYVFQKIQKSLDRDDPLSLPREAYDQLAGMLVEFAEDLHNDIGIWRSYEQYNLEWFGIPLPLTLRPGEEVTEEEMFRCRIHHFLWNVYPLFDPDLTLSPTHDGLYVFSELISQFLLEKFADLPKDSGIKKFLSEPVEFGWEVKRKLVWLGTGSYLFRYFYGDYVAEQGGKTDIPTIDDFICQETTSWSGLGVIDILAAVLDITEQQRRDLRNWYERHLAFYKVLSINIKKGNMEVLNLINDQLYLIRGGEEMAQFQKNMIVRGSLVPWNGEWYWSGGQAVWETFPQKLLEETKQKFIISASQIAYRYCKDLAGNAREILNAHYDEFLKYHGSDLVLYPDGKALAKDTEEQFRILREVAIQRAAREGETIPAEHVNAPLPDMSAQLSDMENGVAVYFNPNEGQEMMQEFNDILSGLEKQGDGLTEDEALMIREFIFADAISPDFVKRVVQEYGHESIAVAFFIEPEYMEDDMFLEYLLRKYKGHFYKPRYPAISIAS